ncbi:uncharacterized protein LOC114573529 [Perca flavescens]|nr:uncharacterized protein LOC114573529 [Perca flavescens]
MGGKNSKSEEPPLFNQPWREINWGDNQSALKYVKDYRPQTDGQLLRILLHGPVGAGKSSFINSVQSVLRGRMYAHALADNTSRDCFTKRYKTFKIQKERPDAFYPFVFNDIMGLDKDIERGVHVDDVKLAMMGQVKEGYRFNTESMMLDDPFYNKHPTNNDKVHVLVCVVDASILSFISDKAVAKMRTIRIEASKLNIPQVAILTKIDEACLEVNEDLKNIYMVKHLKEKMEVISATVGIPMNCIFPVKNYDSEIDLNNDVDSLILSAMKHIINLGDDCINFINSMGAEHSRFGAALAPPILSKPWREINWRDNQSALQYVKDYRPQTDGQQLRILLHGPVGAGKSSFINSVQSILYGRMYAHALVDNTSHDCFTKRYTTYKIRKERPDTFYPFVFNDIMGLDPIKGVHVKDVKLAMMGHVKEDYRFNPESMLSDDQFYNKHPTDNDKVHVLVCVIDANTVPQMSEKTVEKIRDIRIEAGKLRIPQVAILTKIDEVCPEIKDDLQNVYKMKYVKEKMEEFSAKVGIPMNCIFPLKNYNEEIDLNSDVDSLILSALKHIINFGDDCINFNKDQSEG